MRKCDIEHIQFNRKHSEFIEDFGCLKCDYFHICVNKIGKAKFSCPLDDTSSNVYKLNVAKNYAELCDVLEEPTLADWKAIESDSDFKTKYNLGKLKYKVSMPKCEPLAEWQKEYGIEETKTHVTCQFTMSQLRRRLMEFLAYKHDVFTIGNEICNQLVTLLVPMDYIHLFQFTKEKKNGSK